ncbi:PqqD family peptide modification chaperone, partial [Enterococcus faecium]|nr:PqqD family peptide modification chaperone [Enterococcus faecium]
SIGLLICNKLIETKKISLKELFQWFQEEFPDVPKENLKKDLVVFLQALNNRGIINYTLPKRTSIKEKISCSIKKIQKNLRSSHSIHNEKTLKIFLEVCFHVLKENFPIITFICGVNLLCLLFLFLSFQEIRLEFLWILFPAFSYLVLLMSIILHETTHLILYRKITHHNHGYLSIKTLSMSIVREKVLDRKSNILITFSGAFFVFFLGVLLYFLSDNLWIRIPAFIFMFHIINLLPFFGDGHTIITELLNSND